MITGLNRRAIALSALAAASCNQAPQTFDPICPKIGMFGLKGVEALNRAQVCMDVAAVRMSVAPDSADIVAKAAAMQCAEQIDQVWAGEKDYQKVEGIKELLVPKMVSRSSGLVVATRAGKCMESERFKAYVSEAAAPQ